MAEHAKYCKCLHTYTITKCDRRGCKEHPFWKQGIGYYGGKVSKDTDENKTL